MNHITTAKRASPCCPPTLQVRHSCQSLSAAAPKTARLPERSEKRFLALPTTETELSWEPFSPITGHTVVYVTLKAGECDTYWRLCSWEVPGARNAGIFLKFHICVGDKRLTGILNGGDARIRLGGVAEQEAWRRGRLLFLNAFSLEQVHLHLQLMKHRLGKHQHRLRPSTSPFPSVHAAAAAARELRPLISEEIQTA